MNSSPFIHAPHDSSTPCLTPQFIFSVFHLTIDPLLKPPSFIHFFLISQFIHPTLHFTIYPPHNSPTPPLPYNSSTPHFTHNSSTTFLQHIKAQLPVCIYLTSSPKFILSSKAAKLVIMNK